MIAASSTTPGRNKTMGIFFAVSSAVWLVAVLLSTALAGKERVPRPASRGNLADGSGDRIVVSPESARLRKAVEEQPKNRDMLLQLAASLRADAKERPSPGLVMEAVRAYSQVLEMNRDDPDALLGLATVCFEADILDKAEEYFTRYLAIRPGDLQASTDYSLVLIQGGRIDRAVQFLTPLAETHPERFQMRLTLAVAEKLRGNLAQAKAEANRALERAPNDDAKSHINDFIATLETGAGVAARAPALPPGVASESLSESLSPASLIEQFFNGHPIVGPKVQRIVWPDAGSVEIRVKEFPVEQMPPFAKEKFLASVKTALSIMPEKIRIVLVDDASSRALLEIEAGGK